MLENEDGWTIHLLQALSAFWLDHTHIDAQNAAVPCWPMRHVTTMLAKHAICVEGSSVPRVAVDGRPTLIQCCPAESQSLRVSLHPLEALASLREFVTSVTLIGESEYIGGCNPWADNITPSQVPKQCLPAGTFWDVFLNRQTSRHPIVHLLRHITFPRH